MGELHIMAGPILSPHNL